MAAYQRRLPIGAEVLPEGSAGIQEQVRRARRTGRPGFRSAPVITPLTWSHFANVRGAIGKRSSIGSQETRKTRSHHPGSADAGNEWSGNDGFVHQAQLPDTGDRFHGVRRVQERSRPHGRRCVYHKIIRYNPAG